MHLNAYKYEDLKDKYLLARRIYEESKMLVTLEYDSLKIENILLLVNLIRILTYKRDLVIDYVIQFMAYFWLFSSPGL